MPEIVTVERKALGLGDAVMALVTDEPSGRNESTRLGTPFTALIGPSAI